jgi:arylsulfatase
MKPMGTSDWELFDLATDPGERKDLAAEHPDKVREMVTIWDEYARANKVILPDRMIFESWEKLLPQRVPDDLGYPPMTTKRQFVPPANMLAEPKK